MSRELVGPVDPTRCPNCETEYEILTVTDEPLFIDCGYGHARATTLRVCPCGISIAEIAALRPASKPRNPVLSNLNGM